MSHPIEVALTKKPHKSFPEEADKRKIKAQAEQIKWLEKEVKRLEGELKTVEAAFKKAAVYMSDESGPIPVEKLIKDANSHKALKDSKKDVAAVDSKEATRAKWARWISERSKSQDED
jgi:ABC-type phosphate transport system auxiliary subunit